MSGVNGVAAVVVSYNTRELLRACIASLLDARRAGEVDTIIVVDSGSDDGSVEMARSLVGEACVLQIPNQGYGAAANAGIDASAGRYVLVLNADAVIPTGTVRTLASYLDENPYVGMAGPRLRYPDGSVQPTRRRFPKRLTPLFESTIIEEWWPGNRWVREYRMGDVPDDTTQEVDWLVGAALLVRRSAIEQSGAFDPSFRMYSEEIDWCWRFWRRGWRVVYVPEVEIIHYEGASTGLDVPARQFDFDLSRIQLMERMYGRRHATFIRYSLLAGYVLHLMRDGSKWLLGHRREMRKQRVLMYARLMRTGLRPAREERTL